MADKLIAIDATLVGKQATGDATYWQGLLHGLTLVPSEFRFLLLTDSAPPATDSARFRWLRLPSRPSRWFSLVSMPLAARRHKAAAYHTQYNLSPLARRGITTIHDVSFFIGPEWFRPRDLALLRRFVPASARRAAKVITVSETSRRDILKHIALPLDKVAVTPLAAPSGFRRVDPVPTLSQLGIESPYLLAVGTRWPRKNLDLAVRAAELLPSSLPHRLVVTGKPGWGEAAPGKRVVETGYLGTDMLPAVYSGADLYLCPSLYEGFGLTLLEAFACGAPVLSSTGGSLPEVAGDAAELLDDYSPEAWAARIEALLSDSSKLAAMREKGLRRSAEFSWEETARLTLDVYREVANG